MVGDGPTGDGAGARTKIIQQSGDRKGGLEEGLPRRGYGSSL